MPIVGRGMVLALALLASPMQAWGQSRDCPEDLTRTVPAEVLQKGGIFYLAQRDWPRWELLSTNNFAIPRNRLEVIYVPPSDLCADKDVEDDSESAVCGEYGFLLVKTHKKTGAASDGQVVLSHGTKFSKVSGFRDKPVRSDRYQFFHNEGVHPADRIVKVRWHQKFTVGGSSRSTFDPRAKKVQFLFKDEALQNGFRMARLLRFGNPGPNDVICVPFNVTWNSDQMELQLEIMLTDPVVDLDGYNPHIFSLKRGEKP